MTMRKCAVLRGCDGSELPTNGILCVGMFRGVQVRCFKNRQGSRRMIVENINFESENHRRNMLIVDDHRACKCRSSGKCEVNDSFHCVSIQHSGLVMNKFDPFFRVSIAQTPKMQKCSREASVKDCSPNLVPDLVVPYMQKVVER
jgi:hypothetical protein